MNILKCKKNVFLSDTTDDDEKLYNEKFADKYVYCVNWKYAVLLEKMSNEAFISKSREVTESNYQQELADYKPYFTYKWLETKNCIDYILTETANNTDVWKRENEYLGIPISLENTKLFRTKIAELLYNVNNIDYPYATRAMLNYYKENKLDDTIQHLLELVKTTLISPISLSSCSCAGNTTTTNTVTNCDPIQMYRSGVYAKMVEQFSLIEFWTKYNGMLLKNIKDYIDSVISYNLPLVPSTYVSDLAECGCDLSKNVVQERYMNILRNLSWVFGLFISKDDTEITKNSNKIGQTLKDWATFLYDNMQWT